MGFYPPRLWTHLKLTDPPNPAPLVVVPAILLVLTVLVGAVGQVVFDWGHSFRYGFVRSPNLIEFMSVLREVFSRPSTYWMVVPFLAYGVAVFSALLLFPWTLRQCRIQRVHILRLTAYATSPLLPCFTFVLVRVNCIGLALRTSTWA